MNLIPSPAGEHPPGDDPISVGDPVAGRTRLLARQCDTCIFKPGNPMRLAAGRLRDLVYEATRGHSFIVCHQTLPYADPPPGTQPAVCRGFYDRYTTTALQVAARLWGFLEVPPPGATAKPADDPRTGAAPQATPATSATVDHHTDTVDHQMDTVDSANRRCAAGRPFTLPADVTGGTDPQWATDRTAAGIPTVAARVDPAHRPHHTDVDPVATRPATGDAGGR